MLRSGLRRTIERNHSPVATACSPVACSEPKWVPGYNSAVPQLFTPPPQRITSVLIKKQMDRQLQSIRRSLLATIGGGLFPIWELSGGLPPNAASSRLQNWANPKYIKVDVTNAH